MTPELQRSKLSSGALDASVSWPPERTSDSRFFSIVNGPGRARSLQSTSRHVEFQISSLPVSKEAQH